MSEEFCVSTIFVGFALRGSSANIVSKLKPILLASTFKNLTHYCCFVLSYFSSWKFYLLNINLFRGIALVVATSSIELEMTTFSQLNFPVLNFSLLWTNNTFHILETINNTFCQQMLLVSYEGNLQCCLMNTIESVLDFLL